MTDKQHLSEEQQAISDYLDALLAPALEAMRSEPAEVSEPFAEVPLTAAVVTHEIVIPDVVEEERGLAVEVEVQSEHQPEVEPEIEAVKVPQPAAPKLRYPQAPVWAQSTFKVLLFKVGDIQMAVPLVKLSGMVKKPGKIKPIELTPAWYVGLMNHRQKMVQVVDTHTLIHPNGLKSKGDPADEHVMLVCDGVWGLTVDKLQEVISVEPDDVNWRGFGGKRPWLAGIISDKMAAILDVDGLKPMLEQSRSEQ